jgi:hypothetical protein
MATKVRNVKKIGTIYFENDAQDMRDQNVCLQFAPR